MANGDEDLTTNTNTQPRRRRSLRGRLIGGTVAGLGATVLPQEAQVPAIMAGLAGPVAGGVGLAATPRIASAGTLDSPEYRQLIAEKEAAAGGELPADPRMGPRPGFLQPTATANVPEFRGSVISGPGGPVREDTPQGRQEATARNVAATDRATEAVRSLRRARQGLQGAGVDISTGAPTVQPQSQFVQEREARNRRVGLRSALQDASRGSKTRAQRQAIIKGALEQFQAGEDAAAQQAEQVAQAQQAQRNVPQELLRALRGVRGGGTAGQPTRKDLLNELKFKRQLDQDEFRRQLDLARENRAAQAQTFGQRQELEDVRREVLPQEVKGRQDLIAGVTTPASSLQSIELAKALNKAQRSELFPDRPATRFSEFGGDIGETLSEGYNVRATTGLERLLPFGREGQFVLEDGAGHFTNLEDLTPDNQELVRQIVARRQAGG